MTSRDIASAVEADTAATRKDRRPAPSGKEREAFAVAAERSKTRHERVQIQMLGDGPNVGIATPHNDDAAGHYQLLDALGTTSEPFASYVTSSLMNVARARGMDRPTEGQFNAALAMLDGHKPANEVEALLLAQAFASFDLAMDMAARTKQASTREMMDSLASISTKMMRTFTAQIEALAKMRRGGSQTVRVEHVHVHAGGQAIVGNVQTGGRGNGKAAGQSDGIGGDDALGYALLGSDPEGYGVPIPSGEREAALQDARRDEPRRAERQS